MKSSDEGECRILRLPRLAPKAPPGATPGDAIAEQVALLADLDSRYDTVLRELSELDDRVRGVLLQFQAAPRAGVASGEALHAPPDSPRDRVVA